MEIKNIISKSTPIPANVADVTTPVGLYMKLRDEYPNTILLESSDYHGNNNSMSFICFKPRFDFIANGGRVYLGEAHKDLEAIEIGAGNNVPALLDRFIKSFKLNGDKMATRINGLFGYTTFDAVQYFDTLKFSSPVCKDHQIPQMRYTFYKYIIAFNHFSNQLHLIENLMEGEASEASSLVDKLYNRAIPSFKFKPADNETSNLSDEEYMAMVVKGKEHCYRGDVFQIVLSRQFRQSFKGDELNVYRALRNINPSPYLFYFDYGAYKIFGSSPEAQLVIQNNEATINPIAGTFKRSGDDARDQELAVALSADEKENAEHVMLVDLARNDLSRNCEKVHVKTYKEVQYYSHVLHLVSDVRGQLKEGSLAARVMADTFPAGTLSGAPKYKAMQLIDGIENQNRGYYGGCIGNIGLDGSFNQAIMIRSFLSKNNTLFYQAGAGVVSESKPENELAEVNNKLGALKKAIEMAKDF